ncbi:MAG: response regulator [Desulfomonile tiedjei]|uniref:Response regulator n=1 Tax=Desulfomonile tiedjei TaxID=2358 RepID=A0A9D6Z2E7_9BACT|nr:response regulator [Desulfomonile tiedjei]
MKEREIIVVTDTEQLEELRSALFTEPYRIIKCESCSDLQGLMSGSTSCIVILDLDEVCVDNRFLKKLKTGNAGLSVLAISSKKFHPELRESMSSYIHACLSKPVDPEELLFWLKSITLDNPQKERSP